MLEASLIYRTTDKSFVGYSSERLLYSLHVGLPKLRGCGIKYYGVPAAKVISKSPLLPKE